MRAVDAPRTTNCGYPSRCKSVLVSAPAEEHACKKRRNGHKGFSGREEAKWLIELEFQTIKDMFDPVINKIVELILEINGRDGPN